MYTSKNYKRPAAWLHKWHQYLGHMEKFEAAVRIWDAVFQGATQSQWLMSTVKQHIDMWKRSGWLGNHFILKGSGQKLEAEESQLFHWQSPGVEWKKSYPVTVDFQPVTTTLSEILLRGRSWDHLDCSGGHQNPVIAINSKAWKHSFGLWPTEQPYPSNMGR